MGVPLIPDYYHENTARGLTTLLAPVGWKTTTYPELLLTPEAGKTIFVRELHLLVSTDLDLTTGTMVLSPAGNFNGETTLVLSSLTDILAAASSISPAITIGSTVYHLVIIELKPPIRATAGKNPAETVSLSMTGTPTLVGTVTATFVGHEIDTVDLGLGSV